MAFYDTIRNPSAFHSAASDKRTKSFQTLSNSARWKPIASDWGQQYLFACRVICKRPSKILPFLQEHVENLEKNKGKWNDSINELLDGPTEDNAELRKMSEAQIIQAGKYKVTGYVWASLVPLLEPLPLNPRVFDLRERNRVQSSSASSDGDLPEPISVRRGSTKSVGFIRPRPAPLPPTILTARFAGHLIRCILNTSQPLYKASPYLEYRDESITYSDKASKWQAIDSGGIQVATVDQKIYQVTVLNVKSTFQRVENGRPTVPDQLLSEIVGGALAIRESAASIFKEDVIVIVAIQHYMKFLQFHLPSEYMNQFKELDPMTKADNGTYLNVYSTEWLDATDREGRQDIIYHVLALVDKTDCALANGNGKKDE